MTPPEAALWSRLRGRRPDRPAFRRQHPVGPYILDFYCAALRLAVEIDGEVHAMGDYPGHDLRRSAWLRDQGVEIIRIPARDVLKDADAAAEAIWTTVRDRLGQNPPPSFTGEGDRAKRGGGGGTTLALKKSLRPRAAAPTEPAPAPSTVLRPVPLPRSQARAGEDLATPPPVDSPE